MSSLGKIVLVIEDDENIRDALAEILEYEGYGVRLAENGREGLERLAEGKPPDLILLDLMMPVMSGPEFLKRFKNLPAFSHIPVLVLSATATKENTLGASGFVKKPPDVEMLLKMVASYARAEA